MNRCLLNLDKRKSLSRKKNIGSPFNIIFDLWSGCIDCLDYFDIKITKSETFQDCFRKVYMKGLGT